MIIIYNLVTGRKNNLGTNKTHPDGNMPVKLNDNEVAIRVHDDGELAKKIKSAYDYDFVFGTQTVTETETYTELEDYIKETIENPETGELEEIWDVREVEKTKDVERTIETVDVNVTKTIEQYRQEIENHPDTIKVRRKLEIQKQLESLDKNVTRGLEDTLDMLKTKGVIADSDIPAYVKSRKQQKQALRVELQSLN